MAMSTFFEKKFQGNVEFFHPRWTKKFSPLTMTLA
jgi:hypothetical protein